MKFRSIFQKIVLPMVLIVCIMGIAILGIVGVLFRGAYEELIYMEIGNTAKAVSQSVGGFMDMAYRITEQLNCSDEILSMNTERQTPILEDTARRNDYFELLYIQDMNGDQTGRSSGELGNRANRWWFIQMLETGEPFVSKSYYSVNTNMACASIFFPMKKDGQDIGVLATDIKLDKLQESVAEYSDVDNGRITFIIDGEGVVVAHPEKTYYEELYNYKNMTRTVTKKDSDGRVVYDGEGNIMTEELPVEVSPEYAERIRAVLAGQSSQGQIEDGGRQYYISCAPIEMDGASDSWAVVTLWEKETALGGMNHILFMGILIAAVTVVLAVILILVLSHTITRPIRQGLQRLIQLSKGDLTTQLPEVTERDETGQLLETMGETVNQLKKIVTDITMQLSRLADGDVSGRAAYVYEGDFRPLGESLETIIRSLNRSIRQVSEHSAQVMQNADSLSRISQSLAQDAAMQAGEVEELTRTVENVSRETDDSAQVTLQAKERMEQVRRDMEEGNRSVQELIRTMDCIYQESEKISGIAKTIEDISSQTNILALNAAVEAARTGEAGAGFSVIAGQVRTLAMHCAEAVQSTSQLIENTLSEIRRCVDVLHGTAETISRSTDGIREADALVGGISETAKAQAESLNQIAAMLERTSAVVKNSSEVAGESAAASVEMQEHARQLKNAVARYRY